MPKKSLFSKVDHIGVIVRDVDKAAKYYESLGIGPFKSLPPLDSGGLVAAREMTVLGKPVDPDSIKLKTRIAKIGPVNLEVTQPDSEGSLWMKFLETKGEGINHVAFCVDDIEKAEAELIKKGFKLLFSTRFKGGGGDAYFDTGKIGGVLLTPVQWPAGWLEWLAQG